MEEHPFVLFAAGVCVLLEEHLEEGGELLFEAGDGFKPADDQMNCISRFKFIFLLVSSAYDLCNNLQNNLLARHAFKL